MSLKKINVAMYDKVATNVMDFGALGDGITDDTAAIQRAIDSSTGVVILPKGTYKISLLKMIDTKVHLMGDGAQLVKDSGSADKTLLVLSSDNARVSGITFLIKDNTYSGIYMQKANYCEIFDCVFKGEGNNTTSADGAYGIHVAAFESGITNHNWIWDINRHGDTSHNNIHNCRFDDVGFGVRCQTEGWSTQNKCFSTSIENCVFENTWYESIECFFSDGNIITQNRFRNIYNGAVDCDKGSSFNTISNNIIDGIRYSVDSGHPEHRRFAAIKVAGGDAASNGGGTTRISTDNTITGNVIKNASTSSFTSENPYGGIVLQITENTTVADNVINLGLYVTGCDGIKILGRCLNSTITGNVIRGCYTGIATQGQKYSGYTWDEYNMDTVIIANNTITDFAKHGIYVAFIDMTSEYLNSRKNFRLQNNTIKGGRAGCDVSIQATGTQILVYDNTVLDNTHSRAFRINGLNCYMRDNFSAGCAGTYSWIFNDMFTPVKIRDDIILNTNKNEEPVLDRYWKPQSTNGRTVIFAEQVPTSGYFEDGDVIRVSNPSTGDETEWICTRAGYATHASSWNSSTTYGQAVTVAYQNKVYLSLVESNLNHTPNTSTGQWKLLGDPWDYKFSGNIGS